MACSFKIDIPGLNEKHIEIARTAIVKHGGFFEQNGKGGAFEIHTPIGKVDGSFVVKGEEVEFKIDRKPFLLSCHLIEKEVRKYIGLKA